MKNHAPERLRNPRPSRVLVHPSIWHHFPIASFAEVRPSRANDKPVIFKTLSLIHWRLALTLP